MGSLFSRRNRPAAAIEEEGSESGAAVITVHSDAEWSQNWLTHSQSNKLMVIDFSASWCGPCRFIEPYFKEMATRFTGAVFFKIDVDQLRKVSNQWKVEAMPTFVLVKRGQEVGRVVGADKDELERTIQMHLNM
ncbi:hypothetical protein Cni_G17613 [Canna indica]|uniref:Thioredoxin domain-containing protein n=1 Tax=Canna indica TaxID=4628 RepID=A0AAQ3KHC3_9LILI|nr:hypothetical protein Cni_G17613 [Canna indica]